MPDERESLCVFVLIEGRVNLVELRVRCFKFDSVYSRHVNGFLVLNSIDRLFEWLSMKYI